MTKYLVYLKNSPAAIMVIADEFDWNDKEVIFRKDNMMCAVFLISEIAGWCEMNDGGDKVGQWITVDKGLKMTSYKCSECDRIVRDDTGYDVIKDYPYCHCGAKMGGEQE